MEFPGTIAALCSLPTACQASLRRHSRPVRFDRAVGESISSCLSLLLPRTVAVVNTISDDSSAGYSIARQRHRRVISTDGGGPPARRFRIFRGELFGNLDDHELAPVGSVKTKFHRGNTKQHVVHCRLFFDMRLRESSL